MTTHNGGFHTEGKKLNAEMGRHEGGRLPGAGPPTAETHFRIQHRMEPYFMSQPRGRYAGSQDSGQRHPRREKKSPPQRLGPPYVKAPPRGPAQTASIFKTRSFQFLVDAVGAQNIAIALESTMTRVAELMKGERFTPETAFH